MTEFRLPAPEELHAIEQEARRLRAQAIARSAAALSRWIAAHLPLGRGRRPALR